MSIQQRRAILYWFTLILGIAILCLQFYKYFTGTLELKLEEAIVFAIFCFIAWKSDQTLLYFIGWFSGNLMDFIDKKGGLSIYDNAKYPYGTFFPCHRRAPNFNLTILQTKIISYLATLILILI